MSASTSRSTLPQASSSKSQGFFLPFDPNSPLLVAKGVLATGTLGAITGASIGVIQSKNPFALSINMTINLSIAGLTFFSIREYIVSPLLLSIELLPSHSKRLNQLRENQFLSEVQKGKLPSDSLSEVRWDRLSDSAISGGLTGGILSAAFRGRATFIKAGITSSLIASILQISINQSRVIRLKTLAKQEDLSNSSSSTEPPSPSRIPDPESLQPLDKNHSQPQSELTQSFAEPLKQTEQEILMKSLEKPSFPEKLMGSLTKFLPVRKLSNEEYIQTLENKKLDIKKRLGEIEDEQKRIYDWAQGQGQDIEK